MYCKVRSFYLRGADPEYLNIEVSSSGRGIPGVQITGLRGGESAKTIRKIRTAFFNSDLGFPNRKITVNISPSNVIRDLAEIEFAIAMGIIFTHILPIETHGLVFYGSLDSMGHLIPSVRTIFMGDLQEDSKKDFVDQESFFVPKESFLFSEKHAPRKIYAVESLTQAIDFFRNRVELLPEENFCFPVSLQRQDQKLYKGFSGILGNGYAKRALTISLSGKHNILMLGPSGAGKSILANKCRELYPMPTQNEVAERIKAAVLTGNPTQEATVETPFVAPHILTTEQEMFGGSASPGYVTAGHNGILFLDEMHFFPPKILNSLKTVVDNREVGFSENGRVVKYPADFLLVGAANNCMCGLLGSEDSQCRCGGREINTYKSRMSPSLLERFDILTYVSGSSMEAVSGGAEKESSTESEQIEKAVKIQRERFLSSGIESNSRIPYGEINKACPLAKDADALLKMAVSHYGLSTRSVHRILSVARTIADLEGEEKISSAHVAEAVQYRVKNDKP